MHAKHTLNTQWVCWTHKIMTAAYLSFQHHKAHFKGVLSLALSTPQLAQSHLFVIQCTHTHTHRKYMQAFPTWCCSGTLSANITAQVYESHSSSEAAALPFVGRWRGEKKKYNTARFKKNTLSILDVRQRRKTLWERRSKCFSSHDGKRKKPTLARFKDRQKPGGHTL